MADLALVVLAVYDVNLLLVNWCFLNILEVENLVVSSEIVVQLAHEVYQMTFEVSIAVKLIEVMESQIVLVLLELVNLAVIENQKVIAKTVVLKILVDYSRRYFEGIEALRTRDVVELQMIDEGYVVLVARVNFGFPEHFAH